LIRSIELLSKYKNQFEQLVIYFKQGEIRYPIFFNYFFEYFKQSEAIAFNIEKKG